MGEWGLKPVCLAFTLVIRRWAVLAASHQVVILCLSLCPSSILIPEGLRACLTPVLSSDLYCSRSYWQICCTLSRSQALSTRRWSSANHPETSPSSLTRDQTCAPAVEAESSPLDRQGSPDGSSCFRPSTLMVYVASSCFSSVTF